MVLGILVLESFVFVFVVLFGFLQFYSFCIVVIIICIFEVYWFLVIYGVEFGQIVLFVFLFDIFIFFVGILYIKKK